MLSGFQMLFREMTTATNAPGGTNARYAVDSELKCFHNRNSTRRFFISNDLS